MIIQNRCLGTTLLIFVLFFAGCAANQDRLKTEGSHQGAENDKLMPHDDVFLAGKEAYEKKDFAAAKTWFIKSAEKGHIAAQVMLASLYHYGATGVPQNFEKAIKWYRKAAEQGVASAQVNLGSLYINGQGTSQNYQEALKWFHLAGEQGFAQAQYNLGVMHKNGNGVQKNYSEALKWYRLAAEQGLADAQYSLGKIFDFGQGVKQNRSEAVKWYQKAADQGLAKAQFDLGTMYERGEGVNQNYKAAVNWYRPAAEQGMALAQYNLGVMYWYGHGVQKDLKQAIEWWSKAASRHSEAKKQLIQAIPMALREAVSAYKSGKYSDSFRILTIVAGLENAEAQYSLGAMYDNGHGVSQNYKEAVKWYRKAAEQGLAKAQFNLGNMYGNGQGVTQDYKKAGKWWRKAAEQGLAKAQFNLGKLHLQKTMLNLPEALKWLSMSAKQGVQAANDAIFKMASVGFGEAVDYWNKRHPEKYLVGFGLEKYSYFDSTQIRHTPNGIAVWITHQNRSNSSQKGVVSVLIKCDEYLTRTLSITVYMGDNVQTIHPEKIAFDIPRPSSPLSNVMDKVCKGNSSAHKKEKINTSISFGTGWPVSASYVVTNNHVIAGHTKFTLLRTDGVEVPATVVMRDTANDLALLEIQDSSKMPRTLRLASMPARIGDKVFTIGYPHPTTMGAKPKLTDGIVSAVTGIKDDPRTYQISVPLQAGNSGGPLLNMDGEVVGIVTAKLSAVKMFKVTGDLPQNVNYAVKSPYLSVLLSTTPKGKRGRTVSIKDGASLADLAESIKGSVMIVVAE